MLDSCQLQDGPELESEEGVQVDYLIFLKPQSQAGAFYIAVCFISDDVVGEILHQY